MDNKKGFEFDLDLLKSYSDDDYFYIEGIASDNLIDQEAERIDLEALKSMQKQIISNSIPIYPRHKGMEWDDEMGIVDDSKILSYNDEKIGDVYQLFVKLKLDKKDPKVAKLESLVLKGRKIGMSVGGSIKDAAWTMYTYKGKDGLEKTIRSKTIKDVYLDHICITKQPVNPRAWITNIIKSLSDSDMVLDEELTESLTTINNINNSNSLEETIMEDNKEATQEVAKVAESEIVDTAVKENLNKSEIEIDSVDEVAKATEVAEIANEDNMEKAQTEEINSKIAKITSSLEEVKNLLNSFIAEKATESDNQNTADVAISKSNEENLNETSLTVEELEQVISKSIDDKLESLSKAMSMYEFIDKTYDGLKKSVKKNKDKIILKCDCYTPGDDFYVYLDEVYIDNTAIVSVCVYDKENHDKKDSKYYKMAFKAIDGDIEIDFDSATEVVKQWVSVTSGMDKSSEEIVEVEESDEEVSKSTEEVVSDEQEINKSMDEVQDTIESKNLEGIHIESSPFDNSEEENLSKSQDSKIEFATPQEYFNYLLMGGKEIPEYTTKFAKSLVM